MRQHIIFQRVESAVIFALSTFAYFYLGFGIVGSVALLFVFDITMVGYIKGSKVGAYTYNVGHSLTLPLIIVTASWIIHSDMALAFGLIWLSHIGLDRMLGYGLKLTEGFSRTHLGKIGRL